MVNHHLPPITQEEKKLVNHLKKKKRSSGNPHVYFNRNRGGKATYLNGRYYSQKNRKSFTYRSAYELKFFEQLDNDDDIISYEAEAIDVPYTDTNGKKKTYVPDVLAVHADGSMTIYEVKPKVMLTNATVRLKALACRKHFAQLFEGEDILIRFKFITEDDLFATSKEYNDFVKINKL